MVGFAGMPRLSRGRKVLRSEAEATAMPYLTVYGHVTSDGYYQRNDNYLLSLISQKGDGAATVSEQV